MNYKVEKDWTSKEGYRCVIIMSNFGHRCGYVGVTKNHPLYNCDYFSTIPKELFLYYNKVLRGPVGKRGIIDVLLRDPKKPKVGILFDVHGGVTYSGGKGDYPVESNLWWFGYDCGHDGDAKDLSVVSEAIKEIEEKYPTGGVLRSLEYCIKECESLSTQLKEVEFSTSILYRIKRFFFHIKGRISSYPARKIIVLKYRCIIKRRMK